MPMGEKTKSLWQNSEYREYMSNIHKGHKVSNETKQKISNSHKGKKMSEETKKRLSLAKKGKKGKPHSEEWKKKMRILMTGKPIKKYIIGWFGYKFILKPNHPFCDCKGYVREHRLVIEKQIGRYLKPEEKCHHIGKWTNNRPKMLMAFVNHSAHRRFEGNPNNVKPEEIIFDGRLL